MAEADFYHLGCNEADTVLMTAQLMGMRRAKPAKANPVESRLRLLTAGKTDNSGFKRAIDDQTVVAQIALHFLIRRSGTPTRRIGLMWCW